MACRRVLIDEEQCLIAIASKSCFSCENYKAVHPRHKTSFCKDGSKTVFEDSGCDSWKIADEMKDFKLPK